MTAPLHPEAECGSCKHFPAYHDGQRGRPCRAWAPDDTPDQTTDNYCKCPGWQDPAPKPIPATVDESIWTEVNGS